MLDALAHDGQPPEREWPYLATLPSDLSEYRPPVAVSGVVRHGGERLNRLEHAEALLLDGWPIVFGLVLSIAFFRLGGNAILRADNDVQIVGRHAMLAVGVFSDGNDQGYLMRNSWGQKWGDQGYGFVSKDYVMPRIVFLGVYRG
jgi:hypothetical protein